MLSFSLRVTLLCNSALSLNHSIDWLAVILCTHPSINHYEKSISLSLAQFSRCFSFMFSVFFLFHCSSSHSLSITSSISNGIGVAFVDYADHNDDAAADNNIDGKFIFRFHWNNTHFSLTGNRHRQNAFFYVYTEASGFALVNEASTKCCIQA